MLIKGRAIGGLLASVCLISMLAGGAAFAQDTVVDETVVGDAVVAEPVVAEEPVVGPVEEPALEPVVDPEPVVDTVEEPIEIAVEEPAITPQGTSLPKHDNFDDYTLTELQEVAFEITNALERIADTLSSEDLNDDDYDFYTWIRGHYESQLAVVNGIIQQRTKKDAPVSDGVDLSFALDTKPTPEFCAGLVASGDHSDCGWRFSQTQ